VVVEWSNETLVVCEGLVERGDVERFRGRSLNVLDEVPFDKFVVRFGLPFTVIVVDAIINGLWELGMMCVFIVDHVFFFFLWMGLRFVALDRAHNLSIMDDLV
jgi:hypothetical protein